MTSSATPAPPSDVITSECCSVSPPQALNGDGDRAATVEAHRWLWRSGEPVVYNFVVSPKAWRARDAADKDVVREAFNTWKATGMGLNIVESPDPFARTHIVIAFARSAGTWSKIGSEAIGAGARTMNFARSLQTPEGRLLALHEVGHALGFKHEHLNPTNGIVWKDPSAVRAHFAATEGWTDPVTDDEVITKLPADQFGNYPWDPDSIMNYRIPADLMKNRSKDVDPKGLSKGDIARALRFYPRVRSADVQRMTPFESQILPQRSGEQGFFEFTPKEDRKYQIRTFGESDVSMSLYERGDDGVERYMATDDDSGLDTNAQIEVRLFARRRYIVRLRVLHTSAPGQASVMVVAI